MAQNSEILLEVDARRRVSLGSLALHDRYLATVEDDGTIVLQPAIVVSVAQARLNAAPETGQKIDDFLANPETGVRRRPRRQEGGT